MSISIKNLYHDVREVGKNIKSTKKYFVWEFVLNDKHHKVELFHSVLSRKKKLCLDAIVLNETKSFSGEFTFSFKIDKNFFYVVQIGEKYDLRIDNKSFNVLMTEDKNKVYQKEPKIKGNNFDESNFSFPEDKKKKGKDKANDNASNFFNDTDFDFTGGNKQTNKIDDFNNYSNKFSNAPTTVSKKESVNLLDINDIYSQPKSQDIYKKNENILNNININLFDDKPKEKFELNMINNNQNFNNYNEFNQNNYNNISNYPEINKTNLNLQFNNNIVNNQNDFMQFNNNFNKDILQPKLLYNPQENISSNSNFNNSNNNNNIIPTVEDNEFKKNLIKSKLVDLDNLLDEGSNKPIKDNLSNNYNFNFNGINPNNFPNMSNLQSRGSLPMNLGYNNPMGLNNIMNPQMNMYNIQQPYQGYSNTSNVYQQRKSTPFDL